MTLALEITGPQAAQLGAAARKVFTTSGGTIGRLPSNDWIIPDPFISGCHARIHVRDGAYLLEDTSTNGISINSIERRLHKGELYPLRSGDRVFIDTYEIKVTVTGAAPRMRADATLVQETLVDYGADMTLMDEEDLTSPIKNADAYIDSLIKESRAAEKPAVMPPPSRQAVDITEIFPLHPPADATEVFPSRWVADATEAFPSRPVVDTTEASSSRPAAEATEVFPSRSPADATELFPLHPAADATEVFPSHPAEMSRPPPAVRAEYSSKARQTEPSRSRPPQSPPTPTPTPTLPPRTPAAAPPTQSVATAPPAPLQMDGELKSLLTSVGVTNPESSPTLMNDIGRMLRVMVAGLVEVLRARERVKDELGMSKTTFKAADNNPLKFSVNAEDAFHNLFVKRNAAYLQPIDAVDEAFEEVKNHQIAMLAAVKAVFAESLQEFDPDRLQAEFDRHAPRRSFLSGLFKPRYWNFYRDRFRGLAQDPDRSFRDLFAEKFTQVYEEQLRKLKNGGMDRQR